MTDAALVLIHGGGHDARCWQPTVDALAARAPDRRVLAVDLPGRGRSPAPLRDVTLQRCVRRVIEQIDEAGLDEVVLVGHSMAGITLPGVAIALGPSRVRGLVFIACSVPPEGGSILDVLRGPLRWPAVLASRLPLPGRLPGWVATATFCNGMTAEQKRFVADRLCGEAASLVRTRVSRVGLDRAIPRTWILTTNDRAVSPAQQRQGIDNLGGVDELVELAAPHDAMVSHGDALAALLLARVG